MIANQSSTAGELQRTGRLKWKIYRPEEHLVWELLFRRRVEELPAQASRVFRAGLAAIGLEARSIPDLRRVNRRLALLTGWGATPVGGYLPPAAFFGRLARRRFPTTVAIRPVDRLDYTPEPDIFHDVFGHVPLHADPSFASFLQGFGRLAGRCRTPEAMERMARLFWFTVEFGLVREAGRPRIYGSGLISSGTEARHALGPDCERRPFELAAVLETPFEIDRLQPVLYVIERFADLLGVLGRVESFLGPGLRRSRPSSPV